MDTDRQKLINRFMQKYGESLKRERAVIKDYCYTLKPNKRISKSVYSFEIVNGELTDDRIGQRVYCTSGRQNCEAEIIGGSKQQVVLRFTKEFCADKNTVLMKLNDSQTFEALQWHFENICRHPSELVEKLICEREDNICNDDILCGQTAAINRARKKKITFIWGPPGTGKTYSLAEIAKAEKACGHRVLILSHSNSAVDEAAKKIIQNDNTIKAGEIIRYGYPRDREVIDHEFLTTEKAFKALFPDECKKKKNGYKGSDYEYDMLDDFEDALISNAAIILTTLSKACIDEKIYAVGYDTVILDEVSMVYVPHVIFAASLAVKHLICVGDFQQLEPVVIDQIAKETLTQDIFGFCGITKAVVSGKSHRWLVMLDKQYRMHPEIAQFISREMYGSLLQSDESTKKRTESFSLSEPIAGMPIAVADVSGFPTNCRTYGTSRLNLLSALISVAIAAVNISNVKIAIISPYRFQYEVLRAIIEKVFKDEEDRIVVSTVHSFQGAETDCVIYDSTESYPQRKPGIMLSSTNNNFANRLFNVGITRARGKFIAVTDCCFFADNLDSNKYIFASLLHIAKDSGRIAKNEAIIEILKTASRKNFKTYLDNTPVDDFCKDIEKAQSTIYIERTAPFMDNEKIIIKLREAGKNGCEIQVNEISGYNEPVTIIDEKILWYGLQNDRYAESGMPTIRLKCPKAVQKITRCIFNK